MENAAMGRRGRRRNTGVIYWGKVWTIRRRKSGTSLHKVYWSSWQAQAPPIKHLTG